jgi:hypothetical protein
MRYISSYKRFNEEFLNKLLGKDKKEVEKPAEQKPAQTTQKPVEEKPTQPTEFKLYFTSETGLPYDGAEIKDNQILNKSLEMSDIFTYKKDDFEESFLHFTKAGLTVGGKGSDIYYVASGQDESGDTEGYYNINVQKLNAAIKAGKVEIVNADDPEEKIIKVK